MLRYCRDKLQRRKHVEVFLIFPVRHPRTIYYRRITFFIFQFFQGERITDDVLRKIFYSFVVVRFDQNLIMDAESRGMPPLHYHFYEGVIYQPFLFQHLEYMSTEKLSQLTKIHLRHDKKIAALQEETVCHQGVEMGMPAGVISEGLNGHDDSRNTGFLTKGKLEKFRQTLYSTLAELAQQFAVIEKESAQDFGDGEDILAVRNRVKNRFLEVVAELDHLLGMAGGTKPSSSTRKRQNVFVMAIRAFYTGEAFAQISAF